MTSLTNRNTLYYIILFYLKIKLLGWFFKNNNAMMNYFLHDLSFFVLQSHWIARGYHLQDIENNFYHLKYFDHYSYFEVLFKSLT